MARLIELGVPITIRGDWWQKASEWALIKKAWKGAGVYGRDYRLALQCSKVTIGMLIFVGNRDLHTQRSSEGTLWAGLAFCAELEHEHMYDEGIEAEFWSSPEECAEKCFGASTTTKYRKDG